MSCSTSSSQETGSIQSADLSGLSGGSYNDFRSHGPLPIRGLDKFENEPAHHQGLDERQVSNPIFLSISSIHLYTSIKIMK